MKKNILALAVLSFTLFSCGDSSGGNKSILPADNNSQTETTIENKISEPTKKAPAEATKPKIALDSVKIQSEENKNH